MHHQAFLRHTYAAAVHWWIYFDYCTFYSNFFVQSFCSKVLKKKWISHLGTLCLLSSHLLKRRSIWSSLSLNKMNINKHHADFTSTPLRFILRSAAHRHWSDRRVLAMLALWLNAFSHTTAERLAHATARPLAPGVTKSCKSSNFHSTRCLLQ